MHPSRKGVVDFLTKNKNQYEVVKVEAFNHCPRDELYNPNQRRKKVMGVGGSLLDLGMFVYQQADEVAQTLGFNFKEALDEGEIKEIKILFSPF